MKSWAGGCAITMTKTSSTRRRARDMSTASSVTSTTFWDTRQRIFMQYLECNQTLRIDAFTVAAWLQLLAVWMLLVCGQPSELVWCSGDPVVTQCGTLPQRHLAFPKIQLVTKPFSPVLLPFVELCSINQLYHQFSLAMWSFLKISFWSENCQIVKRAFNWKSST